MSFRMEVGFVRPTYDASSSFDNAQPEWPPHPARLFNGLVDAASQGDVDGADEALQFLEHCEAPNLVVPAFAMPLEELQSERVAFVPTNQHTTNPEDAWKTAYLGRIAKGPRVWPRTSFGHRMQFVWSEEILPNHLHILDLLAKQVPYLGRATSPVIARCVEGSLSPAAGELELVPGDGFDGVEVSVPRPGYLQALRTAHERGIGAHQVPRRWVSYTESAPADDRHRSAFEAPVVIGIARPRDPRHLRYITGTLRAALEQRLDGGPVELHGHPEDDEPQPRHQIALVGLTSSFGEHADGLIRGLGIVFPQSIDPSVRHDVLAALGTIDELRLGRLGVITLDRDARPLVSLRRNVWTRAANEWTTVAPMVSDRYLSPTDEDGWKEQVRRACQHADLPLPELIEFSKVPWAPGSQITNAYDVRRPLPKDASRQAERRRERPRPAMHVRIRFPEPAQGPVMLGNLRYYGFGLCVPIQSAKNAADSTAEEAIGDGD